MSHLQFTAGSGGKNRPIGTPHRGAVTPQTAHAFVEREKDFARRKQNVESLDAENAPYLEGQWVDPTPEADRRMLDIARLRKTFDVQVPVNGEELLAYSRLKEDQAHEIRLYKLAAAAIDPKRPQTQAKFMAIKPALETKPNEAFEQRQMFERCIRNLIFYGDCNSEEDLEFLQNMLSDDVVIPIAPAWDITNLLGMNETLYKQAYEPTLKSGVRFKPFGQPPQNSNDNNSQRKIKFLIVCRCLPSFQKHADLKYDEGKALVGDALASYNKLIPFFEAKVDASFQNAFEFAFANIKKGETDLDGLVTEAQRGRGLLNTTRRQFITKNAGAGAGGGAAVLGAEQ